MNPFDNVGTLRVSRSLHDRLCRLAVSYQDAEAERGIVALRDRRPAGNALGDRLIADAVAVTRATRVHEFVRQGSSVRGAIDLVLVARELAAMRTIDDPDDDAYPALSARRDAHGPVRTHPARRSRGRDARVGSPRDLGDPARARRREGRAGLKSTRARHPDPAARGGSHATGRSAAAQAQAAD